MIAKSTDTHRPTAEEILADAPPVRHEPGARERIRAANAAAGRRIAVLDDDPTGSQTVHHVSVVTVFEADEYAAGLADTGVHLLHPDQYPQPVTGHRRRTELQRGQQSLRPRPEFGRPNGSHQPRRLHAARPRRRRDPGHRRVPPPRDRCRIRRGAADPLLLRSRPVHRG